MDETTKKQLEVGHEMNVIEKAKDQLCQETGMTRERLEELKGISQQIMESVKAIMKPIDSSFERAYILNMISEKCGYVAKLSLVDAMEFNNANDDKCEDSRQDIQES